MGWGSEDAFSPIPIMETNIAVDDDGNDGNNGG
jgi:hypothetical protein